MEIIGVNGYQLEKEMRTSPEDAFVRSEVTYFDDEKQKTFYLLYLEYFDRQFSEFTPYEHEPVMTVGDQEYHFKQIAALAALLNDSNLKYEKRRYVHDFENFKQLYEGLEWEKLNQVLMKLSDGKTYNIDKILNG
ncbi:hypothetical protein [Salirhabdus salicampi]|uniref:hypothetical protein n=1 Tax=Salirhabdus salicampi TaxID=476102 RepID=UPI0020C3881C|nr:hypothetical protein [Salirhabdus salicampi]MCP8616745.1 hypothetical protein [Salirhabdus salicampi]